MGFISKLGEGHPLIICLTEHIVVRGISEIYGFLHMYILILLQDVLSSLISVFFQVDLVGQPET